jgi:hypothetical protein
MLIRLYELKNTKKVPTDRSTEGLCYEICLMATYFFNVSCTSVLGTISSLKV